jgi:ABC-type sugar transport system ATPase subunit
MAVVALEMRNINKSFYDINVLKDVSLEVRAAEVHALLGENGAGKSVLMKTLMGVHRPDSGEYIVNGMRARFRNPAEAMHSGVSMVYQEFGLVPHLSVAENILMGRLPTRKGLIMWREAKRKAKEALERLGSDISPNAFVGDLKVAEQQEVEIARALSFNPRVFIMDEPSAALSREEIQHSYDIIDILREQGVAIVYITHKLEEVFDLADRVTIIRDGSIVGTYAINELDYGLVVERMTGKKISEEIVRKDTGITFKETVLEIRGLAAKNLFRDVNLTVGRGEIVGVVGVIGAGKTELSKAIIGALPKSTHIEGQVIFNGIEINLRRQNPGEANKMGIGYVTEDRMKEGLVPEQSVLFNIILPAFRRVTRGLLLIPRFMKEVVTDVIKAVQLRPPDPKKLVINLSGGNQQKVVLGKWLASQVKLLILDEPTRGVDVGAREEIYEVIREQAKEKGLGVLLLSSDLREVMFASDRILIMRGGTIVADRMPHNTTERELLSLVLTGTAT